MPPTPASTARPHAKSIGSTVDSGSKVPARVADLGLMVAFLALTFLLGAFPLKDTDFWWHLKAGEIIRQTHQVPTSDDFTYGAEGHTWVDLHWVFQVALSWGYEHGGVVGLNLAKCGITTLAVFVLIGSRKRDWPVWVMLLAWLPALLVLNGRMYIRPETISLLYLSIVLAILFRWDRVPWLAFGLPVVQACWVNTQGLFLLEPIVVAFALLEALIRPGSLAKERRGWWRIVGVAVALMGVACLCNPYGPTGALYPIQLAGTMSNPIFKNSIGELKPLLKFVQEVGFDSLPLRLHVVTFVLGLLSFLLPLGWGAWSAVSDRVRPPDDPPPKPKQRSAKRSKTKADPSDSASGWRPPVFRFLLFGSFSALSLAATRNSHQFAAVVGTVTAWNFAEWAGAIRSRRLRLDPAISAPGLWPRLATLAAIGLVFASVASGRFYAWSGEGRTVGLGEEALWFPHEAVKFAGSEGMPDRLVGFHNGHPALYEYYFAPKKKVYTDARLEVVGPELYKAYLDLGEKIRNDTGNWALELDKMGRPAVLIDNLDQGNAPLSATLLKSRHYRCVWFDPIVSLFVHDSYAKVVADHRVDFAARHFRREADASLDDPTTLAATARALRFIGSRCRVLPGAQSQGQAMLTLGLDYSRKLQAIDHSDLEGWKQAGLIEFVRGLILTEETIPRFRLPYDPVFDLAGARASYDMRRALEIAPDDGTLQYHLYRLDLARGMDEPAEPWLAKFAAQPNINLSQRERKAEAVDLLAGLRKKLGPPPSLIWANLSELERVVASLVASGRASTLADFMESAYRVEARSWDWSDRLAVLRLHLGEPARARAAWVASNAGSLSSTRSARIAATYLVEGDFDAARRSYREALAADPGSFEAHYGLAVLERDDGRALEATEQARLAIETATGSQSRSAARAIFDEAKPYVSKAAIELKN